MTRRTHAPRRALAAALALSLGACRDPSTSPAPGPVSESSVSWNSLPDHPPLLGSVQGDARDPSRGGALVVWGDNSAQQISDAPAGQHFSKIAPGGPRQGLVLGEDGSLRLWGSANVAGSVPPLPASVANGRYDDVALSLTYLLAIRNDHSVVAWGRFYSANGNGPSAAPPSGLEARDVAGGATHALAIQVDHTLRTWGSGLAASTPPAGKFSLVAARSSYSIALRRDGTLFGWGSLALAPDIFGKGKGWVSDGKGHFFVPNDQFVAIAAGNNHILALRADGTVAAWGKDVLGSTRAPAGIRFTAIAAGSGYSLGLDREGALHLWGDAGEGRGAVPAGRFVAIGAGARHAAALRFDGKSK
jgi:hypothetical protein